MVYIEYMKAFDTMPHGRLLIKLSAYGFKGKILVWIRDFLRSRKQRVVVNSVKSEEARVSSGIPQGSVLGPLLFVIFINDLPENVRKEITMFADNTKLYARSDKDEGPQKLQEDLNAMQAWSDKWLLRFHPQKCSVMKLGVKKSTSEYSMPANGPDEKTRVTLRENEVERDLGVFIDNKLTFKDHVAKTTAKANRILGLVRRSFDHLSQKKFTQLFKSLVRPILEYGHCV